MASRVRVTNAMVDAAFEVTRTTSLHGRAFIRAMIKAALEAAEGEDAEPAAEPRQFDTQATIEVLP